MNLGDEAGTWRSWIGRQERQIDLVTEATLARWGATLDRDLAHAGPEATLPPLAHWALFPPVTPQSELGADGHPARGAFLPPIRLPRRMWAGGRLRLHEPLRVGDTVQRESTILAVDGKVGRAGPLVFVTVRHLLHGPRGLAVDEQQDIVYRGPPVAGEAPSSLRQAPRDEQTHRAMRVDATLLFRYSALTFNAHRIHYDRDFAMAVEGYPGLVVQGPLVATLLLDTLWRERPAAVVKAFDFRAVGPLFDGLPFSLCARDAGAGRIALWARNHDGHLAMQAEASLT